MTDHLPDAQVAPWGHELFKHMDETHGLILTLSEMQEIVRITATLREPPHCPTCSCAPGSWGSRHNGIEFLFVWMRAPNPMLGMVTPEQMIRFGRGEALLNFINEAREDYEAHRPTS